jgi:hypothetical protein
VTLRTDRRAVRNGRSVTFTGSVAGAPVAARRLVALQVRIRGRRWSTFATTRLTHGTFARRYRFTRTTSRHVYRFRVLIAAAPDWPFAAGASRSLQVMVRPTSSHSPRTAPPAHPTPEKTR